MEGAGDQVIGPGKMKCPGRIQWSVLIVAVQFSFYRIHRPNPPDSATLLSTLIISLILLACLKGISIQYSTRGPGAGAS